VPAELTSFYCGCCKEHFPSIHRHVHHKIPRATGGPDTPDNLIELCPGCHDALHSIAYKLLSPKVSQTQILDQLRLLYKDNDKALRMCMQLAKYVRDALLYERENGKDPDQLVSLSTTLHRRHKDLIMVYCRENRISQESYFRNIVLRHLATLHHLDVAAEMRMLQNFKKRSPS
jgi:hypothetical protein